MPVSTAPAVGVVVTPTFVPGSLAGWRQDWKEGNMWCMYPAFMGVLPSPNCFARFLLSACC
jgi:hypothetical protein